jgi:GH25 family lysozyme M1 (1,4-beta-N-acetylmuramidase)
MSSDPRRTRVRRRAVALAGVALLGAGPALVAIEATGVPVAPAAPADNPTQARGVDVSNYQHPGGSAIDWSAVRASGVEFAFVKATEGPVSCSGNYYTNSWLRRDWGDAGAAGLYRGAYHFARPGDVASAIAQARYFAAAVGPMTGPQDLPPVLDLEVTCGLGPADLAAYAHAWVNEVTWLTGRRPIIYSGYYFWKDNMRNDPSFADLPFWIATYGPRPMVPPVWSGWTFWQYSSSGAVPGINGNVDMDVFTTGGGGLIRFTAEGSHLPRGNLDAAAGGRGSVSVAGWAFDPDAPQPLDVHVYVDGRARRAVTADQSRPDVAAAYTGAGPAHGFSVEVPEVDGGRHQVCVWALNIGPGANTVVGCATVDVARATPYGWVDAATGGFGRVDVSGWAIDPDTTAAVPTHVYVDGALRADVVAGAERPDVGAANPGSGSAHGFSAAITGVAPGDHDVCTYALNIAGYGANEMLACRRVRVNGGGPTGSLDWVTAGPASLRVAGWAFDQDTAASIPVHVYVDGTAQARVADADRPDVGAAFPVWGPRHGYDVTVTGVAPGEHRVCVYGIDVAGGNANALVGCRTARVLAGMPLGSVDAVTGGAGGTLTVQGWTIDPDAAAATDVHVYVDGRARSTVRADRPRPDLLSSPYSGYGAGHGYAAAVTDVAPGVHVVCVYAIDNAGAGTNALLGCRTVAT